MSEVKLPDGWVATNIREILQIQSDGNLIHQGWSPKCHSYPADTSEWGVLKTTAIQDGYFLENQNKELPKDKEPKPRIEIKNNDLLITNAGPRARCGVVTLVRKTRSKLMISGKMYRLRFSEENIDSRFIEYWFRTYQTQKYINTIKTGISESGLNMTQDNFFTVPVIIPSFAEQSIVADELDELLAQVNILKNRLNLIPSILKRFRKSVLENAVSGRLLQDSDKIKSSMTEGVLIDLLIDKPKNGYSPLPVNYITPIKSLTLTAVTSGKLDESKIKYVDIDVPKGSHLFLNYGDILIQRANSLDYVGVSAVFKSHSSSFIYPDLMMKIKANSKTTPDFLHLILMSDEVRNYFRKNATGTTGNMPKINQQTVMNAPVRWPLLEEQNEIVQRVGLLYAYADQIEQRLNDAQSCVNHLTQSILAKAFRGELTADWREQNPDLISGENSAEALMARIQAEREASGKVVGTRRKKVAI